MCRLRFRVGIPGRPDFGFHHPLVEFILRIPPDACQFARPLANLLPQQFLSFKNSVDTCVKVKRLQKTGQIEFLAVLVNQYVESVTAISFRDLHVHQPLSGIIDTGYLPFLPDM